MGSRSRYRQSLLGAEREHPAVVDLPVVEQHVRVHVGGDAERPLPDERADLCPRAALPVQERDPPVPQVVRRERRDLELLARLRDRGMKRGSPNL